MVYATTSDAALLFLGRGPKSTSGACSDTPRIWVTSDAPRDGTSCAARASVSASQCFFFPSPQNWVKQSVARQALDEYTRTTAARWSYHGVNDQGAEAAAVFSFDHAGFVAMRRLLFYIRQQHTRESFESNALAESQSGDLDLWCVRYVRLLPYECCSV
ncbi:hypothetical protein MRX96_036146 [Rhipicephalus microplus]